nr:DNA recombination protein RmuC [uncultured Gellertiella sp.]
MSNVILSTPGTWSPLEIVLLAALFATIFLIFLAVIRAISRRMQLQSLAVNDILRSHAELQGRLTSMTDLFGQRQQELNRVLGERLDGMSGRIGSTLQAQANATHQNLQQLHERLAVIDTAQNNIQTLARDMAGLQAILANKQTRGAFGQGRMESIVSDGLPLGAYDFQPTLSNGTRPDCVIRMPNGAPDLVIDAKFPLEGWTSYREAPDPAGRQLAAQQFRRDMELHIRTIAEKYLLAGETQDTAFLFVPSESIFSDIHESFDMLVQKAQRARVMIVSPSLLMLSVQLMQAILRDHRMREQAHLIQAEVAALMQDLGRLDDRVGKLQSHFTQAQKDVDGIVTSSTKIARRGDRISDLDLSPAHADAISGEKPETRRFAESRTGLLKLRVVDEE